MNRDEPLTLQPSVLPITADTVEHLRSLAAAYAGHLATASDSEVERVCFTASLRSQHEHRLAVVFQGRADLVEGLRAFVAGESRPGLTNGQREEHRPRVAFVFCGQGAQWWGMGRSLLAAEPVFRGFIEDADRLLVKLGGWSLLEQFRVEESRSRLGDTEVAQPALFALQAGLAALWRSWGVEPDGLVGHSVGEIAAAYVAGALTLEEAIQVAYHRGRFMQRATGGGKMAAVELSLEEAERAIEDHKDHVSIAAVNGPRSMVLAGETAALAQIVAELEARKVTVRMLRVNYAFHSPQMDSFLPELLQSLNGIKPQPSALPLFSTVTGNLNGVRRPRDLDGTYWCANVRQTVLFNAAINAMSDKGYDTFLEVGPHPVLGRDISGALEAAGKECKTHVSLRREEPDRSTMLGTLGALHAAGRRIEWKRFFGPDARPAPLAFEVRPEDEDDWDVDADDVSRSMYEIRWQKAASRQQTDAASQTSGKWVILADRGGAALKLASVLRDRGQDSILVYRSTPGFTCPKNALEIGTDGPAELRQVFASLVLEQKVQCRGVVHLWSLDVQAQAQLTSDDIEGAQDLGCYSVLHLVQALAQTGMRDAPRLWVVTRGVQVVHERDDNRPFLTQAPLWGLGRTVMHEHPALRCSLVDLAPGSDAAGVDVKQLQRLADELVHDGPEAQVAIRGDTAFVARLAKCPPRVALPSNKPFELRADGVYVVTGGLGGVGLEVAAWLRARGARQLLLLDRASPSASAVKSLAKLNSEGTNARVIAADVTTESGLSSMTVELEKMRAPLRGVIHAAGLLEEGIVLQLNRARFSAAMAAKLAGANNVLRLCANHNPDFVVLVSSTFSVLGAPRYASLAAGDAFQAAVAGQWRIGDRRVLSIHWSPWSGVGVAGAIDPKAYQGISIMTAEHALGALERLVRRSVSSAVAVMPFDARQWRQSYPKLADLALLGTLGEGKTRAVRGATPMRAKLEAVQVTERWQLLLNHVQEQVGALLKPGEKGVLVDAEVPLDSFGLDSIKALDLRNRLERSLGVALPATLAWGGHPTIDHLASAIAHRLGMPPKPAEPQRRDGEEVDDELIGVLNELRLIPE